MSFQSKAVYANGIKIHYLEWGEATSPDLLLVHGWATTGIYWFDVAEGLSDRYHIIAPDNRGNGESEVPAGGYLLRDYAEDLRQLVRTLGLRRPFFAGNSWGANIGAFMAAEYPEEFSKVLLEDPICWKMADAFVTIIPELLARRERPESEIHEGALSRGLSAEQAQREVYLARHFSPEAITQVSTRNRDWALKCEAAFKRIGVPTLILVADQSAGGYISREELEYYRQIASPKVRFRFWEGVGHSMHASQPDRFIDELHEFLAE